MSSILISPTAAQHTNNVMMLKRLFWINMKTKQMLVDVCSSSSYEIEACLHSFKFMWQHKHATQTHTRVVHWAGFKLATNRYWACVYWSILAECLSIQMRDLLVMLTWICGHLSLRQFLANAQHLKKIFTSKRWFEFKDFHKMPLASFFPSFFNSVPQNALNHIVYSSWNLSYF